VFVNFQEDGAVRSLAKALLKKDFDLEIELPHGCLVPRVPQRLNYILFIEDLLKLNQIEQDVVGIDIGQFWGGEVAFVGRLIDDSVLLQTQVR
ncbi:hypothetical protein TELCIR_21526, partial [Teladorsagia circumcincta]